MVSAANRKPFQGVLNILRFNWHFYAMAFGALLLLWAVGHYTALWFFDFAIGILVAVLAISLVVSCYIYDFTGFYTLDWLDAMPIGNPKKIININAGFDETSALLQARFPEAEMTVLDFYDPEKHTEVSIKRARKKYPPYPRTVAVETRNLTIKDGVSNVVFLIFAAHEIRDFKESLIFFAEVRRILDAQGKIVLVEHLRDWPNFLAYTVGFFHFFPKSRWHKIIEANGLKIASENKLTPFTHVFIITKNGNPS